MDLNKEIAELTCPGCGCKIAEPLSRLKNDPTIVCPACKQRFVVNAADLRKKLGEIDEAIRKVDEAFKSIGKKR